jgi:hypothetical protein
MNLHALLGATQDADSYSWYNKCLSCTSVLWMTGLVTENMALGRESNTLGDKTALQTCRSTDCQINIMYISAWTRSLSTLISTNAK